MKNILAFNSFILNENYTNSGKLDLGFINSKLGDKNFVKKIENIIDSLSPKIKRSLLTFLTNTKVLDIDKMLKYFKLILKSKSLKNKNKLDDNEFIEEISSELGSKNESFLGIVAGIFVFLGMSFICLAAISGVVSLLINSPDFYEHESLFHKVIITVVGVIVITFLLSIAYLAGAGALSVFAKSDKTEKDVTVDVKIDNEKVTLKLTKDELGNYKVEEIE